MARFLQLTLYNVSYAERQDETALLNKYRPPPVSEWRTSSDLLPSDVDNPDETIASYGEFYAERLAALLHKEVPEVMRADPQSLPPIDYYFWHFDYPSTFGR